MLKYVKGFVWAYFQFVRMLKCPSVKLATDDKDDDDGDEEADGFPW